MQVEELYNKIGGDYEEIKGRLMNEAVIQKFLLKFPDEPSYDRLLEAVESRDIESSFNAAHTLKGVAANLSFKKLYTALSLLNEQLRPRKENADEALLAQVKACYEEVVEAIRLL